LNIRRPGLEQTAQIQRARLVYEGGSLKPTDARALKDALENVRDEVEGVEVLFQ
jgi:hypothetical protein